MPGQHKTEIVTAAVYGSGLWAALSAAFAHPLSIAVIGGVITALIEYVKWKVQGRKHGVRIEEVRRQARLEGERAAYERLGVIPPEE